MTYTMDDNERLKRARAGEITGGGAIQIRLLVAREKELEQALALCSRTAQIAKERCPLDSRVAGLLDEIRDIALIGRRAVDWEAS